MAMDAQDEERPLIHHLSPQDETSEFTSDGTVDISNLPARKQRTGNWTACFFILGAEFTECVAFFAISKNLVTYLTGVLHESNVNAATTVSTWIGTAFFKPLIGAFLADTLWGRYWTIVIFISVYVICQGMMILTGSALLPLLMGLSYNRGIHRLTAYLGLSTLLLSATVELSHASAPLVPISLTRLTQWSG